MAADIDSIRPNPKNTLALAISAACAGVPAVQAQAVLEEIIVTATKRESNLQEVALAITAFTEAEIVRQGFKTFSDYVGQIPALSVVQGQPGATNVLMRGCATQGVSFTDSSTTSVYLDEQPITASGYNPDPRLVDVARVEALGGPQGTLFGDAAQCGTLRIITNKPDASQFSSWVDATGMTVDGGDAGYDLSAMVNIPIVKDTLALRLVGFVAEEPGYIDNVLSPSPGSDPALGVASAENFDNSAFVDDDVNTGTYYGGRAGLRWNATENWTVDLSGIYQNYELDGFGDVDLNDTGPMTLPVSTGSLYADTAVFPTLGEYEQIRFSTEDWEDEWYQVALTVEGNLGFADLVVTGAYFNRESEYDASATAYLQAFQQVNTYYNNNNFGTGTFSYYCSNPPNYAASCNIYDFNGDPRAPAFDGRDTDSYTFEARLSSPTDSDSRWGWLGGVFYNHREVDELFTSNVTSGAGLPLWDVNTQQIPGGYYLNYSVYNLNAPSSTGSNNWWSATYDTELDQWAVFGEISFDITDNFSITAGGRYYDIENDYTVIQGALIGLNGGILDCATDFCWTGAGSTATEADDDGFVPKLNLTYRWTDQMVYFTYSEGFRRGGANSARAQSLFGTIPGFGGNPAAGSLNTYEGDTVNNWEVGAKTEWLDNTLRFNITAYYMDWEDIQIQITDPFDPSFSLGIVNAPQADIYGVDSWLAWAPTESIDISATLGWNDAELSEDFEFPEGSGNVLVPDGTELPLMPDWKGSLVATYTFGGQLFSATPYVLAQYVYWGESTNSVGVETLSFTFPIREQPDWQTLGLRLGLDGETWSAVVYVDNIFDEYQEMFYNNRWAQQRLSVGQPRTFGIGFRKSFGGNTDK